MLLKFKILVVLTLLSSVLMYCHLSHDDDHSDEVLVYFEITVKDSASGEDLDGVEVTIIYRDTLSPETTTVDKPTIESIEIRSNETKIQVRKDGYKNFDTTVTMDSLNTDSLDDEKAQLIEISVLLEKKIKNTLTFRLLDENLEVLRLGRVIYRDSSNTEVPVEDADSNGVIDIPNLKLNPWVIKVEHPGYLGKVFVLNNSDSLDAVQADLLSLDYSLKGRVSQKTATSPIPLSGALVRFTLSDSLVRPREFIDSTDENGIFQIDSLPLMSGELAYFFKIGDKEPIRLDTISESVLKLSKNIDNIVLDPAEGDSGLPLVIKLPADTISSDSALRFVFSQSVDPKTLVLRVNQVDQVALLSKDSLADENKELNVRLFNNTDWKEGFHYQYQLEVRNNFGESFKVPGEESPVMKGFFYVQVAVDSSKADTLKYPDNIRIAYFFSGLFDEINENHLSTTPNSDSTTRYAVLKWDKPETGLNKNPVDSLVLTFSDQSVYSTPSRWITFPTGLDSLIIRMGDYYHIDGEVPSSQPSFPLKANGSVNFAVYSQEGNTLKDSILFSQEIKQNMGKSVYLDVMQPDSLNYMNYDDNVDTLEIRFLTDLSDTMSTIQFAGADSAVNPFSDSTFILRNNFNAQFSVDNIAGWEWNSDSTGGKVFISLPGNTPGFQFKYFSVGLGSNAFEVGAADKPLFLRNEVRINVR